ncbi:hypothetical protein BIFGAL_03567 [Bifidobacterium gallicum DSM 20093 = LMG 11596]|uniref:Uncharacterized protein n=1 Tax=Bifidobacterium gallicum DSM 20093 = LMG 11596 TaxID=561180 RepID=D1NUP1_9BIFI|nr:hypothetical protein BIFGAL_03567 [Bifidobacterium gallicum DSM 20093 = LMG 11596]
MMGAAAACVPMNFPTWWHSVQATTCAAWRKQREPGKREGRCR